MKVRKSVILGVCGSVLGMVLSLIWMIAGSEIWANVLMETRGSNGTFEFNWSYFTIGLTFWGKVLIGEDGGKPFAIPPTYLSVGFLIASFQCIIAYILYVITLAKSLPKRLGKNPRVNRRWLSWVGIITFIINPFLFIPCLMLFTAGSMSLKGKREIEMNI
ncbi:hypothetical protein [Neobacillus sp. Marseille-QA0830]